MLDLALRLILWGLRRHFGGAGRSWLVASAVILAFQVVRSVVGRRPVVEKISIRPGDSYLIEHLGVTHGQQLK